MEESKKEVTSGMSNSYFATFIDLVVAGYREQFIRLLHDIETYVSILCDSNFNLNFFEDLMKENNIDYFPESLSTCLDFKNKLDEALINDSLLSDLESIVSLLMDRNRDDVTKTEELDQSLEHKLRCLRTLFIRYQSKFEHPDYQYRCSELANLLARSLEELKNHRYLQPNFNKANSKRYLMQAVENNLTLYKKRLEKKPLRNQTQATPFDRAYREAMADADALTGMKRSAPMENLSIITESTVTKGEKEEAQEIPNIINDFFNIPSGHSSSVNDDDDSDLQAAIIQSLQYN